MRPATNRWRSFYAVDVLRCRTSSAVNVGEVDDVLFERIEEVQR